jgi:hypothetical protein
MMKRILLAALLILLCTSTLVAAAQATRSNPTTVKPATGTSTTTSSSATTAPPPTTTGAQPTTTRQVWIYQGTTSSGATQEMLSTENPAQFNANKPAGWITSNAQGSIRVPTNAVDATIAGYNEYGTTPATYNGRVVFNNYGAGRTTIIDGTNVYTYEGGRTTLGTVTAPDGNTYTATQDSSGKITYADLANDGTLSDEDIANYDLEEETAAINQRGQRANQLYTDEQYRYRQFGTFSNTLATFAQYYRQYSGMSGWSSLIFDEEFLAEWRNTVNEIMCEKLHVPTRDCWTSKICAKYYDIETDDNGVLYSMGGGRNPRAVAHIEGKRSPPLTLPNQTSWVYTVTFSVTNPDDDDTMSYNVLFSGSAASANWWSEAQTIATGQTATAIGAEALIKHSVNDYNEVCLTFSPKIKGFDGSEVSKICNSIVQQAGTPTAPYNDEDNTTVSATADTAQPGAGAGV